MKKLKNLLVLWMVLISSNVAATIEAPEKKGSQEKSVSLISKTVLRENLKKVGCALSKGAKIVENILCDRNQNKKIGLTRHGIEVPVKERSQEKNISLAPEGDELLLLEEESELEDGRGQVKEVLRAAKKVLKKVIDVADYILFDPKAEIRMRKNKYGIIVAKADEVLLQKRDVHALSREDQERVDEVLCEIAATAVGVVLVAGIPMVMASLISGGTVPTGMIVMIPAALLL